jgi:hypothetical protein
MFWHVVNRGLTLNMVITKWSTPLTSWPFGVLWVFGGRSVAPPILYLQTKCKWVDKFKPRSALPQEWISLPIVLKVVLAPEVALILWKWKEMLAHTGTRSPDLSPCKVDTMPNTLVRME